MENLIQNAERLGLSPFLSELEACIAELKKKLDLDYGKESVFRKEVENLPGIIPTDCNYSGDWVKIGAKTDMTNEQRDELMIRLKGLTPWRKGPFDLFGIPIDTEWASNLKWNRLKDAISPLDNKRVLDVGCNSGYYMFRMLAQNPAMVLGIDPQILFYYQFKLIQTYAQAESLYFLPARLEDLPTLTGYFDTVFCMGIIYHRRSPLDTLQEMRHIMKKGGELILETLIIEGDTSTALFPLDRYAKMKNVFFIPTLSCLTSWLSRTRFSAPEIVDITKTTPDEQRSTEWSGPVSLTDFLDPEDPEKTVEGYPAPIRAVLISKAV